jgi:hypothetical protein
VSRLDLLPSIGLHFALGAVLLAILWGSGFGWVLLVTRSSRSGSPAALALGYAAGLCASSIAAALSLVHPLLGALGLLVLMIGIIHLLRETWVFASLRLPLGSALLALPFVLLFVTILGLFYHGPTTSRSSSAFGDMLFYIAKINSAKVSIHPYHDLLVSGQHFTLTEGAPSVLGAAVSWLPGFDPFLFDAVTLPTVFGLSVCAGIGSLFVGLRPRAPTRWAIPVAVIGASAVLYPSWLVESPPVTLAVPLAFAVFWLSRAPLTTSSFVLQVGLIAVGLALTKVIGLIFVGGIVLYRVAARDLKDEPRSRSIAAVALAAVTGAACVALAAVDSGGFFSLFFKTRFIPLEAVQDMSRELHGGLHIPWGVAAVVGHLLVLAVLFRARQFALAFAFALAVGENWVERGIVDLTGLALGLFATVCVFLLDSEELKHQRWLLTAAALCLGFSALGRDYAGTYLGPVLLVSLGGALLAASRNGLRLLPPRAFSQDIPLLLAFVLAVAIWLGGHHAAVVILAWPMLLLGWEGMLRLRAGLLRTGLLVGTAILIGGGAVAYAAVRVTLPPETGAITTDEYRFWRLVNRAVPPGGLVFTSFTGDSVTQRTGWNYYPGVARRQLFIAGWADSPLQRSPSIRIRRLALNSQVLNGSVRPRQVDPTRQFGSYYAAVDASDPVPSSFERLARVGTYTLYRIRQQTK